MKKEEFIEITGENPEDMFGGDWENEVEEFLTPPQSGGEENKINEI